MSSNEKQWCSSQELSGHTGPQNPLSSSIYQRSFRKMLYLFQFAYHMPYIILEIFWNPQIFCPCFRRVLRKGQFKKKKQNKNLCWTSTLEKYYTVYSLHTVSRGWWIRIVDMAPETRFKYAVCCCLSYLVLKMKWIISMRYFCGKPGTRSSFSS